MTCTPTCVAPTPHQAHCGGDGCHITFGGLRGFDAHRYKGACRTVAEIGYVDNGRGVYSKPATPAEAARLAVIRERNKKAPSAPGPGPLTA